MRLMIMASVTALAAALAVYGVVSIWSSIPLAESIPWLRDALLFAGKIVLSSLIAGVLIAVLFFLWCKRDARIPHESEMCAQSHPSEIPPYPYPEPIWGKVTCFKYKSDLHLMRFAKGLKFVARKDQYVVAKPYTVSFKIGGEQRCVTVPKGMLSDLSSAPFALRCLVGRVGPHLEATIVHDYLYVAWQDYEDDCGRDECYDGKCAAKCDARCRKKTEGEKRERDRLNRRFADRLMLAGMKASGMGCRARLVFWVVRVAGGPAYRGENNFRYVDVCKCNYGGECGCGDRDVNGSVDGGSCYESDSPKD